MQAIVHDRYGSPDVLEQREVEEPVVGEDDVLVKVHAVSLNPLDWHYMRGTPYLVRLQAGLRRPKRRIRGVDVAGTVEAVGANVTEFQPGDEVFGDANGACAELVKATAAGLAHKPSNVTFEQAAAVPVAAFTALQGMRHKGELRAGDHVLINGASGGVGTFAVQIAKSFGAEVTGVCSSRNLDLVRSIGADHVVDYTQDDFTRSGQEFNLILDMVGGHSMASFRRALAPTGRYVSIGANKMGNWIGPITHVLRVMMSSLGRSQTMTPMLAKTTKEDLVTLQGMLESGEITAVIDRTLPLSETAEAMRYLESGRARGKVVVTV